MIVIMTSHSRVLARTGAAVLTTMLILSGVTGCSDGSPASPQSTQAPTAISLPGTAAGELAGWVIEQMNSTSAVDAAEAKTRMDPKLLEKISAEDFAKILDDQRAGREWIPTQVKEDTAEGMDVIFVRVQSAETDADAVLQVSQSPESKLLTGIFFRPPSAVDFGDGN